MHPENIENFNALLFAGHLAYESQNFFEAEKNYKQALNIKSNDAQALCSLAQSLDAQGKYSEAEIYFLKAEKKSKKSANILLATATYYFNRGEYSVAIDKYKNIIRLTENITNTQHGDLIIRAALTNLGVAYKMNNQIDDAIDTYFKYTNLFGKNENILINLANALEVKGKFQESIDIYREILLKNSNLDEIKYNLAEALSSFGQLNEAEEIFRDLELVDQKNAQAKFGLSLILLKKRKWTEGWEKYQERWNYKKFIDAQAPEVQNLSKYFYKLKHGTYFQNKNILIVCEQGIGDNIMFAAYLEILIKENRVSILCDARLVNIFKNSFNLNFVGDIRLIEQNFIAKFDIILPIGDLPYYALINNKEVQNEPYLKTGDQISLDQFNEIERDNKICVGFSWRGGLISTRINHRSVELDYFNELFENQAVRWVSLQHGDIKNEIEQIKTRRKIDMSTFDHTEVSDINNLAKLIDKLDLVITVQNTNVHISGALGKDCIAIIPYSPEWRYGMEGDKMPWYKTVTLVRQNRNGYWKDTFEVVKKLLEKKIATVREIK